MNYTLALKPTTPAWEANPPLLVSVQGETVSAVEYRPEYTGMGLIQRLSGISPQRAVDLLAHTCPTCGNAHALALCGALETLTGISAPPRAQAARSVLAELERAVSHLQTLGAIFTTLGIVRLTRQLQTVQDEILAARATLCHADSPKAVIVPGGISQDLHATHLLAERFTVLRSTLVQFTQQVLDRRLLVSSMVEVGVIPQAAALQFGLRGPLARSTGLRVDQRVDAPYAAYASFPPALVSQEGGDVYARVVVLLLETLEALKIAEQVLGNLPDGPYALPFPPTLPAGEASASVEAPRGAFHCQITANAGMLSVQTLDPAPQLSRLLARTLLSNANLEQVALIVHSTDPCSGCLAVTSMVFPG